MRAKDMQDKMHLGEIDEIKQKGEKMNTKNGTFFEKKIREATDYLKSIGVQEIILFGSLADGTFDHHSDIDLAVSGISPKAYFTAVAVLPALIKWKVDLVAIDYARQDFAAYIRKYGKVIYAV